MKKIYIYFNTGTIQLAKLTFDVNFENNHQVDIMSILDENRIMLSTELPIYTITELLWSYSDEEINELFIPINGGEFYINNISHIEFIYNGVGGGGNNGRS